MITIEFITALFYEVDEQLGAIPKHPKAHLWPSEVVTLGLLHALKGGGNRANRATTSFTLVGTFADFTLSVLIRRG